MTKWLTWNHIQLNRSENDRGCVKGLTIQMTMFAKVFRVIELEAENDSSNWGKHAVNLTQRRRSCQKFCHTEALNDCSLGLLRKTFRHPNYRDRGEQMILIVN